MLGTCLATMGVGPSIASAGPTHVASSVVANRVIHPLQTRATVADLARGADAVSAEATVKREKARVRVAVARTTRVAVAHEVVGGEYHEVVWTNGFQAQINACRGAVNVTARYHVEVIAEAWQCGGARFPHEGATVVLSGVMSGVYRVGPVVAVLNAYVDKTSDIPRGYPLLYQTCRYGNAHTETFTELIPVG